MPEIADSGLPYEATFIENITRARKAAGMSQTELARRLAAYGLPFHQPTVQRVEAGERPIRLNEAMVICDLFGMQLPEALQPATAERATQELLNDLENCQRGWKAHLWVLQDSLFNIHNDVVTLNHERDAYLKALQSLGRDGDPELLADAKDLVNIMSEVMGGLQALLVEHAGLVRGPGGERPEEA